MVLVEEQRAVRDLAPLVRVPGNQSDSTSAEALPPHHAILITVAEERGQLEMIIKLMLLLLRDDRRSE